MNGTAFVLAVAALAAATAASGCGFGPGDASPGRAELRVTREFGTIPMVTATLDDPTESDTVVRMLDSSADVIHQLMPRASACEIHSRQP